MRPRDFLATLLEVVAIVAWVLIAVVAITLVAGVLIRGCLAMPPEMG